LPGGIRKDWQIPKSFEEELAAGVFGKMKPRRVK
jgi:hypothetical protein